jgi:hypothetical protein
MVEKKQVDEKLVQAAYRVIKSPIIVGAVTELDRILVTKEPDYGQVFRSPRIILPQQFDSAALARAEQALVFHLDGEHPFDHNQSSRQDYYQDSHSWYLHEQGAHLLLVKALGLGYPLESADWRDIDAQAAAIVQQLTTPKIINFI